MQLGKALISHKHCNFLINQGGATAYELEELARKVIDKVKACSGIELEWEMIRLLINEVSRIVKRVVNY